MLGLYDYPAHGKYPAFNLSLRVDFKDGATETQGFRFVGSEGILTIGQGVTVSKPPNEAEPGQTADTFSKAMQDEYMKQYREKYPVRRANSDSMRPQAVETYFAARRPRRLAGAPSEFPQLRLRSRKPVVEDATFGFRAAGPALLSNVSYFEERVCRWDPEAMKMV